MKATETKMADKGSELLGYLSDTFWYGLEHSMLVLARDL